MNARGLCQVHIGNAVIYVGPAENPVESETGWSLIDTQGQNVDPVPVIVERDFIQQIRADNVGCMNNITGGRIVKGVPDTRRVISAPHGLSEGLDRLIRDEVSED